MRFRFFAILLLLGMSKSVLMTPVLKRVGNTVNSACKVYLGATAVSAVAGGVYGATSGSSLQVRQEDGTYKKAGRLETSAGVAMLGAVVPHAAILSTYGALKAAGAVALYPRSQHAGKVRFYYKENADTLTGWNGKEWVSRPFRFGPHNSSIGFKGARWNLTDKEALAALESSAKDEQ